MTTTKKLYDAQEVIDELLYLYRDYDQKITRHHPIMNCVRNIYCLDQTGLTYKEWVKAGKKRAAV